MPTVTRHGGLGWLPSTPDFRDLRFTPAPEMAANLPPAIDLTPGMPEVWDQGDIGSCTGHAIAAAHEYAQRKQGRTPFTPSRLAIYYDERVIEGTVYSDAGAMIRDGFKVLAHLGAGPEALCPYDPTRFARKPSRRYYAQAAKYQAIQYLRVAQTDAEMKSCLAAGYPIVVGFSVYQSFEEPEVKQTGLVQLPQSGEVMLGGHAVLVVGYDDATGRWRIRNSWGTGWGMGGYCTMPYAYLTDPRLAGDFWTLRLLESLAAATEGA